MTGDRIPSSFSWKFNRSANFRLIRKFLRVRNPIRPATRLFKFVANGNAISWFCLPIRSAPPENSVRCLPTSSCHIPSASATFNEQLRGPRDFRRYPPGIRDISALNSPRIVRSSSPGIYLYFLYRTDRVVGFQNALPVEIRRCGCCFFS